MNNIIRMVTELNAEAIKSQCILAIDISPISNTNRIHLDSESFLTLFSEFSFEPLSLGDSRLMITTYINGINIFAITELETLGLRMTNRIE